MVKNVCNLFGKTHVQFSAINLGVLTSLNELKLICVFMYKMS